LRATDTGDAEELEVAGLVARVVVVLFEVAVLTGAFSVGLGGCGFAGEASPMSSAERLRFELIARADSPSPKPDVAPPAGEEPPFSVLRCELVMILGPPKPGGVSSGEGALRQRWRAQPSLIVSADSALAGLVRHDAVRLTVLPGVRQGS
jgi:hypothetical protein